MSVALSNTEILIALHRRLYFLDVEGKKINGMEVEGLYQKIVEEGFPDPEEIIQNYITDSDRQTADEIIKKCRKNDVKISTIFDDDFPLKNFPTPPPIIYMRGSLPDPLLHHYIAFVGARKPTHYGIEMTDKIIAGLAPFGTTIVSGLAYGIDAASHKAAVRAKLPTVAVLGSGIDQLYPSENLDLARAIVENGAVITEFPWGSPPLKHHFPLRNRVISGLSRGVVVVEGMIKSGSLITARWAADQSKEVFAVPGYVGAPMSTGPNLLIKEGAHLVESAEDITGVLNIQRCEMNNDLEKKSGHGTEDDVIRRAIVRYLNGGRKNPDQLVRTTGMKVEELLPLITELEVSLWQEKKN